jgi:hypothetical protein
MLLVVVSALFACLSRLQAQVRYAGASAGGLSRLVTRSNV